MEHRHYPVSSFSASTAVPHVAIVGVLALLVVAHIELSDIQVVAHSATVPVLVLPVGYFAAVFGLRGALASTMLAALVLLDDPTEGRLAHSLLEVAELVGVGAAGATVGALVAHEGHEIEALRAREMDRQRHLRLGPGYWDRVGATSMGLYVTGVESGFLLDNLAAADPGIVLDVGAGTGRLEPTLLQRCGVVVATEADGDVIRSMEPNPRLQPLLVGLGVNTLPFADASLEGIICLELPSVSDESWFRAECARVLRPGGTVIVTVHNAASFKGLWARVIGGWPAAGRRRRADAYYRHGLTWHRRRWKEAGFEEEKASGFYWPPFSRQSDAALVTLFSVLERVLGLRHAAALSPWVLLRMRLVAPWGRLARQPLS